MTARRWPVSRLHRPPHLWTEPHQLRVDLAAVALVVTLTRGDPKAPDLAKRIVYVSNVTGKDDTGDKEIRADCPRGTMLLGGGSAVQHGNESPSVAMYQGYPVANGWEVQAHLTNPPKTTRFPNWDLFAVAICLRT